jgi:hypothetical protein
LRFSRFDLQTVRSPRSDGSRTSASPRRKSRPSPSDESRVAADDSRQGRRNARAATCWRSRFQFAVSAGLKSRVLSVCNFPHRFSCLHV